MLTVFAMQDCAGNCAGNRWLKWTAGFIICCFLTFTPSVFSLSTKSASVEKQLGYLPSNYIEVSAWKKNGVEPVAIKTYPLNGGAKRRQAKAEVDGPVSSPFPTLYWLTCPDISRAVADFERRGYIHNFEQELTSNPELASRLLKCHEEYAQERWNTLTEEDQSLLSVDHPSKTRMKIMMKFSGISGTNFTVHESDEDGKPFVPHIKCLHAHYAQFRSTMSRPGFTENPVGEMIHKQLIEEFPDIEL